MENRVIDKRVFLNQNPDWLSQRLLAIRLYMGLPCVMGNVTPRDLSSENVRRAVSAYYYMILDSEMPNEPVHFGVSKSPDYKLMQLIVTQKKDNIESLFHYTYGNNDLRVDNSSVIEYIAEWFPPAPSPSVVLSPLMNSDLFSQVEVPRIETLQSKVIVPNFPIFSKPSTILLCAEDKDEELFYSQVVSYVGEGDVGSSISLYIPQLRDLLDIDLYVGTIDCSRSVSSVGLSYDSLKSRDIIVNLLPCELLATSWEVKISWMIVIHSRKKYTLSWWETSYLRTTLYRSYLVTLERRLVGWFSMIAAKLLLLKDKVKLIRHNYNALTTYRMPMLMPSRELINQSLFMIGNKKELSKDYSSEVDGWEVYSAKIDWAGVFSILEKDLPSVKNLSDLAPRFRKPDKECVNIFWQSNYEIANEIKKRT